MNVRGLVTGLMLAVLLVSPFAISAAAEQDKPPSCDKDPAYSQQDFTLGTWDVFNKDKKIAQVSMEKALNGCAVRETWKSVNPTGNGMGLFTYSRALKQWKYFWVADTAATTDFNGDFKAANDVLYVTEIPQADGGKRVRHWSLTLLPDGTVREFSVGSSDGQKTWMNEYELIWHKQG